MMDKACQEPANPSRATKKWKIKEDITFFEEDVAGVKYSHVVMVVLILNIDNYNIHRVLVDNKSAVDILYFLVFSWMKLSVNYLAKYGSLI